MQKLKNRKLRKDMDKIQRQLKKIKKQVEEKLNKG